MTRKIALLVCIFVLATSISAQALTLTLNPVGGSISGVPGSTVGWGYTVTNDSAIDWVTIGGGSNFSTLETWVTNYQDFTQFNFQVLAPGASFTQVYDALLLTGIGSIDIDSLATPGWVASGTIDFYYNLFNGDPNSGGIDLGVQLIQADADVTATPEPGTIMLLGSGLMGLVPFRRRFMGKLA